MRLYAAADLHGKRRRFMTVLDNLRHCRADALVLAGDILNYGRGRELLPLIEGLPLPVFMVRGNSDPPALERWAAACRNVHPIHLKAIALHGFELVGVSGTLPIPFHSRAGWREARALRHLGTLAKPCSIVVAHPPPYGCRDQVMGRFSAGSRGLARLIRAFSPAVMVCGHIHEAAGVGTLGASLVVNCALGASRRGALIVLEEGHPPTAEML
jgi:Icc-related predicted phosphoesterase